MPALRVSSCRNPSYLSLFVQFVWLFWRYLPAYLSLFILCCFRGVLLPCVCGGRVEVQNFTFEVASYERPADSHLSANVAAEIHGGEGGEE